MDEKYLIKASAKVADEKTALAIAQKAGIAYPSSHLAIMVAPLAPFEEANQNGVRLSKEASEKFLKTIHQAQCNMEHWGAYFVSGAIIDEWLDESTNETFVAFTFYKELYPAEYQKALEAQEKGELGISFELLNVSGTEDRLADGTIRLNDFEYTGIGVLGILSDAKPAYQKALVKQYAQDLKSRVSSYQHKDLICAGKIINQCDKIISTEFMEDLPDDPENVIIYVVTTTNDNHFHMAVVDINGNGGTFDTFGRDPEAHTHRIIEWQFQEADGHVHKVMNEIMAKVKEHINSKKQKENESMTKEEIAKVQALREEFGELAKDVSDEDLLKDEKVTELRKAKDDTEETEEEKAEDEEKEEEKEEAKTDLEKANERIAELEEKVETMSATLEAKDSETESVREQAELVGQRKVELKDNPFAEDFKAEDYLDEEKVAQAKQDEINARSISERKTELKDNEFAQDFKDEDYLNDEKVALAKAQAEIEDLKAGKKPEKKTAKDAKVGSDEDAEASEKTYQEVMASIREKRIEENKGTQKVYTRE